MTKLSDLSTPAFVINRFAFERNCREVASAAKRHGIRRLRPHVKTHKTVEGALIQAGMTSAPDATVDGSSTDAEGLEESPEVVGFVCSTIPEVSMLVDAAPRYGGPFKDILYGVPISESKIGALHRLMLKLESGVIHVMVDHLSQVDALESFVSRNLVVGPISVFLKLDTGYHRAGITCDGRGVRLATRILDSPLLKLRGIYSHCGHSYDINEEEGLKSIADTDLSTVLGLVDLLKEHLTSIGKNSDISLDVSIGSTPSLFSHVNKTKMPTMELHPGNYTLYDRQQLWTGVCTDESHVAGRVLTRVIGHYEDRNTIMLDAGATALTKDATPQGGVCSIAAHPDLECYKMSQEMTLVRPVDRSMTFPYEKFPLGKLVNLLPNHSCLAAACFDRYHVIDDASCNFSDEEIIAEWEPVKGW